MSAAEAFGEIQADGSFALTTNQRDDGAAPGTYLVTIEPYSYKTGHLRVLKPFPVPQRFWEAETSGLIIEVKHGQKQSATDSAQVACVRWERNPRKVLAHHGGFSNV